MEYAFSCAADIELSKEMIDTIDRLQRQGKLAGGVEVEPTIDEATYRYLVRSGHAEVAVRGDVNGFAFVRWDGAWRPEKTVKAEYGYPPRIKGSQT
jgi:hypothetical protein